MSVPGRGGPDVPVAGVAASGGDGSGRVRDGAEVALPAFGVPESRGGPSVPPPGTPKERGRSVN
ncbi:hypothetical protein [Streptosporangium sp. CA-115845]|uniref:hypothetical protein n=1 Tax=Streptosporangium sp. CA-115845 TaxID=3240071 RepID=UPI003D913424